MGKSTRRHTIIFLALFLIALPLGARALEIQGVNVPSTMPLGGRNLVLNGAGLRTFSLLGIPIRIYVASFYAPEPLRDSASVEGSPGPLLFNFTFLRSVSQSDVTRAWSSQFAQSVSYTYPGYDRDRDAFISMFGSLSSGGIEQVQFVGTNTMIIDQGVSKGVIAGRNFQKSFLSLWFGSNPVAPDLKSALLGR